MANPSSNKPLAITMGDAAGIGPEIIAKAFRDQPALMHNAFVVGDVATLRRAAQVVAGAGHPALPVAVIASVNEVASVPPRCIPVLQIGLPLAPVQWGAVSSAAGAMVGRCVEWAADAALRGDICALVTAPLHKEALAAAGLQTHDNLFTRDGVLVATQLQIETELLDAVAPLR